MADQEDWLSCRSELGFEECAAGSRTKRTVQTKEGKSLYRDSLSVHQRGLSVQIDDECVRFDRGHVIEPDVRVAHTTECRHREILAHVGCQNDEAVRVRIRPLSENGGVQQTECCG